MHRHADRPRLVRDRAGDGLADPPGRIRGELETAAPLELLDGADQAEHALLDEIEERQSLVAVVLGDRDDQAQVRLDHPPLGRHVAALDPLGELDLLGGGEQRVASDLAEEELQRVRRRLDARIEVARRGGGFLDGLLGLGLDDLDPALFELAIEQLDVSGLELEQIDGFGQFGRIDTSGGLCLLEQRLDFVGVESECLVRHEAA